MLKHYVQTLKSRIVYFTIITLERGARSALVMFLSKWTVIGIIRGTSRHSISTLHS